MKIITGGVTAAKGFQAASTAAGIKYQGRTDMAMVYSEKPCVAAGTFTTNIVKAAPVKWDQEIVYQHPSAQVIICNSGIANACTGEEGFSYCRATAKAVAETLNVDENSVLVASTGVIGMQLPIQKLADGVKAMAPKLQGTLEAGNEAAKAIRAMNDRPDGKNIPIIAMTANSFAEDVQASLDAGMNAHLSKPIVIEEVIKTILRYVHND